MKTHSLTMYLIKESANQLVYILKSDFADKHYKVSVDEDTVYDLFVRQLPKHTPRWADLFEGYIDTSIFGRTGSIGAVLLVPVGNRLMALTFGQGRRMLKDDCWEERFGLRVVLNSIGEGRLRSIDKQTFDAIPKHSREQTSRDASAFDFALDVEKDLLRAVTGALDDRTLGSMLTGMDALKTHIETSLATIQGPLQLYADRNELKKYKETFPWVDYIADVRDKETIAILDMLLVDRLRNRDFDRCWLAVPELVEWASIQGFSYGSSRSSNIYNDLHLETFLSTLDEPPDRDVLSLRKVYCIGDDDSEKPWPVYRCLYCEIDHGDESFLLSGGKWYQVAKRYVDEVNSSFNRIERIDLSLEEYDDDSEADYLDRICRKRKDNFVLMDQEFIYHGPMGSKMEFCDIFTSDNDLIHVKRYGNAGVLSHLFSQGLVSGDLLFVDPEFRKKVRDLLPASHLDQIPTERPSPDKYRVIFAIISQSQGPLSLPFFSRLSLRHAANRLEGFGYKVALAKIEVSEVRRKLQKAKKKKRKSRRSR
jgi:uncharacterized protein (TIGR04141 family)